jgi:hypothetical protein
MALQLADRVRETTSTVGTGAVTLGGAVSGYVSFSSVITNGNTTYYVIVTTTGSAWEVGVGTYSSGTLTRDTVLDSSNSNALVNFQAGTKYVFIAQPASRAVYSNGTNIVAADGAYVGVTSGGTGFTSYTTGDIAYASGATALSKLGIGTAGQVLTSSGTAPQWSTLSGIAVTTISFGTTGLTPSSATGGAVTVAGTLATANGGTNLTSFTSGGAVYATSTSALTTGTLPTTAGGTGLASYTAGDIVYYASGTALSKLGIGTAGYFLASTGGAPQWTQTLAVANGGTGSTTASGARTNLSAAQSGANTDITSIALTTGTISTAPSGNTDIVNKLYADSISTGINFHAACNYATTAALSPANTYNNGSSGVGATLTASSNGTLTIDGYTVVSGDVGLRFLIKNEATGANNGVYTLTQAGTASLPYILTRATDYDTSGTGTNEIDQGDFVLILSGSTNANTSWIQQTALPIVVGTTALVFTQFAAGPTYPISIANGGTGATTVATAQTNLQVDPAGTAVAMAIALG